MSMFEEVNAPPEKKRLHADVPTELLEKVKKMVEFIRVVRGNDNVKQSHVVEYILEDYFSSRKKEVLRFWKWREGEWSPGDGEDSSENTGGQVSAAGDDKGDGEEVLGGPETGEFEIDLERKETSIS